MPPDHHATADHPAASHPAAGPADDRGTGASFLRGWRRRCPACGDGPMMHGYLKVRPACPVCGEELHHHRADDGPAYIVILVVGHLALPLLAWVFATYRPDPAMLATGFIIGGVAASLWMLPRVKGAVVAYQWAKRMYGFGRE